MRLFSSGFVDTARPEPIVPLPHTGAVLSLFGLPASGKTTLALSVERELIVRGYRVVVLDGDTMRVGLCADLGFTPAERLENARRAAEVAAVIAGTGQVVITAFIWPSAHDRQLVKDILLRRVQSLPVWQVFVDAPIEVCQVRDPKGMYRDARAGQIPHFTGVSAPFDRPSSADLIIDTSTLTAAAATSALVEFVAERLVRSTAPVPPLSRRTDNSGSEFVTIHGGIAGK